ncbi:MAG TPA: CesT family type III secretion system chaperone [Polyangiaceae bacterium]|nr:CesT family type III secretion system chaperone [Polyangiaceae bacterium]
MRNEKDVEAYLLQMKRPYRSVDDQPGTFLVETSRPLPPIAVRVDPPLVVIRVHIGDIDRGTNQEALYRKLLELNARQLVHASYGIDDRHVVLSSALELENLDFNELQATLDEIDLVLAQQLPELARMAKQLPAPSLR